MLCWLQSQSCFVDSCLCLPRFYISKQWLIPAITKIVMYSNINTFDCYEWTVPYILEIIWLIRLDRLRNDTHYDHYASEVNV